MRILLTGNSPFCQTGYGVQPAQLALQLKALGHEAAIFAYYGLSGSLIEWQGIPVYPNNTDDYGVENVKAVYEHFEADFIITLVDVWVLGRMPEELKWFPWAPIDHEPMPPGVKAVLQDHPGIYRPIAMSQFGLKEMKRYGIECFYVPHMINCQVYSPNEETRKMSRQQHGWEDKFVIGQVGTNVRERKNWTASLLALQKFYRKYRDVVMYCHTDAFEKRGRDLQMLRESLMLQDVTRFPSLTQLRCVGIPDTVMAAMYNSLDVYLHPSKGEGFGIPIIEAQACGVPVIVAKNTAQPELCGGGWLLKRMRPEWDEQSSQSGKTVKDLITEIADGQPVEEEIAAENWSGSLYEHLDGGGGEEDYIVAGERLNISATVTAIGFRLRKHGSPTGNVTFAIYKDYFSEEIVSKVYADASAIPVTATYCKLTLDEEIAIDETVLLICIYDGGDSDNYIEFCHTGYDNGPPGTYIRSTNGIDMEQIGDDDAFWHYNYLYGGITVYEDCPAYEVVFDSEDSLIDTYEPKDSFRIKENEDRLAVIDKLLYHTGCQRIFKNDGKIHVFVPTVSGSVYDAEYSLATGHPFFSKAIRDSLVIPNKIVVRSLKDAETELSGSATSAASYAMLPKTDYQRTYVSSGDQASLIAAAIISRLEIAAQKGSAVIPVDCGAEIYDYVKVTDARENDYRTGNIGSITRIYRAYPDRQAEYKMSFSFGRMTFRGVPGTTAQALISTDFIPRVADGSIPWDVLYNKLLEICYNLHDINVALGWHEAEQPADEAIQEALSGYLQEVGDDSTPELGGELDANNHKIINLGSPSNDYDAATKKYVDDAIEAAMS